MNPLLPAHGVTAAERLVAALVAGRLTVAVAESLTGGSVCDALVAVPGASRCVRGAVVAYATDLKARLLGVDAGLLARVGAVHAEVAAAMARGVRDELGADVGLATTGVAGPDPQDGHEPGTFHVAVCGPDGVVGTVTRRPGPGDRRLSRADVRASARDAVLALALERLEPGPRG
ncbi:CinA family protein [Cellulomonas sp. APG4]|uniref:CinA family protein n=1 Tax=Cellulomonas sp. APG4 TaxID=1538656 RepID=UPI00351B6067